MLRGLFWLLALTGGLMTQVSRWPKPGEPLGEAQVRALAELALKNIRREFPNKPGHVITSPEWVKRPRELHPAFYGCFDWHSAVHGHWMLVRLLRLYPDHPLAGRIEQVLSESLTPANLAAEAAYFRRKEHRAFERPYGWAWFLKLAQELRTWEDPRARRWAAALQPLEEVIVARLKEYLPRLAYPIRTGVHPDTGFALALALDYARAVGEEGLERLIVARARRYYLHDENYPVRYEPSGEDFFSSGLNEADLMRRVLDREAFSAWLDRFLPGLRAGDLGNWAEPAVVTDLADGRLVHLVGLNLSRAWTLRGVAGALPPEDPRRRRLEALAARHADAGLRYVFSGHYEGEHWLASFAVYLLTDAGRAP